MKLGDLLDLCDDSYCVTIASGKNGRILAHNAWQFKRDKSKNEMLELNVYSIEPRIRVVDIIFHDSCHAYLRCYAIEDEFKELKAKIMGNKTAKG